MSETPRYRLLQDSFFAPKMVLAGSIIETHAPPGNHMEPLNDAATARMEEWYNEEVDELDDKARKTGEKIKPHMIYRTQLYEPGVLHNVDVLAEPRPDDMTNSLSLAGVDQQKRDTDQRPGPARIPEAQAIAEQSGAAVVEEAAQTDARKAGVKVS